MKLALRLVLWFTLPLLVVLFLNAGLRLRREAALIEGESARAQQRLAQSLATAIADNWESGGASYALRLVRDLKDAGVSYTEGAAANSTTRTELDGHVVLGSVAPVVVDGVPRGAVRIEEVLLGEEGYLVGTVWRSLLLSLLVVVLAVGVAVVAGVRVVGRPLDALVRQAAAIGDGGVAVAPSGVRDELQTLSTALSSMAAQIAHARAQHEAENKAKLEALHALRRADRLSTVGKLSAGLAHELGTPLNVVMGRADLIATGEVSGTEAQENAQIVLAQAKRMSGIIQQLLSFARARPPRQTRVDVDHALTQVTTMLAPLAKRHGATLTVTPQPPGGAGIVVDADPEQLEQVLVNLTMNAIQAVAHANDRVVVLAADVRDVTAPGAAHAARFVRVCVRDHGPGMDADTVARIFDPFFTTKPVGEGTGLGLAVTHGLVHEHGGFITVDTAVGAGATFAVHFPSRPEPS